MVTTWVLIITIATWDGVGIHHVPGFATAEECRKAARIVKVEHDTMMFRGARAHATYACVPRSEAKP